MAFLVRHLFFISYNFSNFVSFKQNVCTKFFQERKMFPVCYPYSQPHINLNVECIQTNLDKNTSFLVEKNKIKIMNDIFH